VEVLHLHLACAAAAAGRECAGIGFTPGEGEELDLCLVGLIVAFAFDRVDLQEIIN